MYKKALFDNETIRCTQQRFKSDYHNIYTQTVHKTAFDNKDDKRIQSYDGKHTYPYGIEKDLINKSETDSRSKPISSYYEKTIILKRFNKLGYIFLILDVGRIKYNKIYNIYIYIYIYI